MVESLSLQLLYDNQERPDSESDLDKETQAFLVGQNSDLENLIHSKTLWHVPLSDEKIVENWKTLLHLALISHLSHSCSKLLAHRVQAFLYQPWNQHSQYSRVLVALNQFLLGMPVLEVDPYLLESGAAPIELQEYCPWQSIPYIPLHTQFGALLTLLAHLTKREDLQAKALRLAKWQLNFLDSNFFPLNGPFVQEKDGALGTHLIWNYLLFHGIAKFTNETSFEAVAKAQLTHLSQQASPLISPFHLVLERFINQFTEVPEPSSLNLPEKIYDPSTSLVGYRSSHSHAICTLHGGHTGLGCFRSKDVQVVNYGPQYLPLGECGGFGIEGNYLSNRGVRKPVMRSNSSSFYLKGCVRLVDQPLQPSIQADHSFQMGQFQGIWIETEQEFKSSLLSIKTQFLGFSKWNSVAFSFFVKAHQCHVNEKTTILPQTLGRYEGPAQSLIFEGKEGKIQLSAPAHQGNMQVIPLSGGNSFWGADFLVAYCLDSEQRQYQWVISP